MRLNFPLLGFALVLLAAGCGSRTKIIDANVDLHLSGNWNDSDSRAVAENLAHSVATAPWVAAFTQEHGQSPVLRIGRIRVRTRALDDVVDPAIFAADIERALIASGLVRVVANRSEAAMQAEERSDAVAHAAQAPAVHATLAPDVILSGTLLTQDDRVLDRGIGGGTYKQVKFYQLDLAIADITTTEILWRGSVERKKLITQSTLGW